MNLPTEKECMQLLEEQKLDRIMIQHSIMVQRIANFLGKELVSKGERIDLNLLSCSALLHDLDKKLTLENGKEHGFASERILAEKGYPEVGVIVRKHRLETVNEDQSDLSTWEEKIVYYADKRVNHFHIVTLDERYKYLFERYGKNEQRIMSILSTKPHVEKIEKEIFSIIQANPEEMINIIPPLEEE
jgi:hypothetical protein